MPPRTGRSHLLSDEALRELAGDAGFERGVRYALEGRVRVRTESEEHVDAVVQGSSAAPYDVSLRLSASALTAECDCPVGFLGPGCKHAVAVALRWRDGPGKPTPASPHSTKRAVLPSRKEVAEYVRTLDRAALESLVLSRLDDDDALYDQLRLRAAVEAEGADAKTLRALLDRAMATGRFVDYRRMPEWANRVRRALAVVGSVAVSASAAEAVLDAAEHGMRRLERAAQSVDDSDGHITSLALELRRIHRDAAVVARPDPVALADRVFRLEVEGELGFFEGSVAEYAEVLGDDGLDRYRVLAERSRAGLDPFTGRDPDRRRRGRAENLDFDAGIPDRILVALARLRGEPDAAVAVLSEDLSSSWRYLEVAGILLEAGRESDAIAWAERGVEAYPNRIHPELRDFLAASYRATGRHAELVELMWRDAMHDPGEDGFGRLRAAATLAGTWGEWRGRLVTELTRREESPEARHGRALVRFLIWDGDAEGAWSAAERYGVPGSLRLPLARAVKQIRPHEALEIYRGEIERTLQRAANDAYATAIGLLREVRQVYLALDDEEGFRMLVREIVARHGRKPNLMRMLEHEGWRGESGLSSR